MRIDTNQLEFIDKKLRTLLTWLELNTGLEFTITSLYRIGDEGVHGCLPLRGIDLRMRSPALGHQMTKLINAAWRYDTERPGLSCAIAHGKGSGLHLHLQVHPNTVIR